MREDGGYSVIRGVAFQGDWVVRVVVSENGSFGEGLLEHVEDFLTLWAPFPRSILAKEASEWDDDTRVVVNESSIEISKT